MSRVCNSCGSVNEDTNKYCSVCGMDMNAGANAEPTTTNNTHYEQNNNYYQQNFEQPKAETKLTGGQKFGWGALGCCVPIVGLILWLVWSKDRPQEAKCLRNGFFTCIICYVLYFVAIFGIMAIANMNW